MKNRQFTEMYENVLARVSTKTNNNSNNNKNKANNSLKNYHLTKYRLLLVWAIQHECEGNVCACTEEFLCFLFCVFCFVFFVLCFLFCVFCFVVLLLCCVVVVLCCVVLCCVVLCCVVLCCVVVVCALWMLMKCEYLSHLIDDCWLMIADWWLLIDDCWLLIADWWFTSLLWHGHQSAIINQQSSIKWERYSHFINIQRAHSQSDTT